MNPLKDINPRPCPAAACHQCGGWSGVGGMSQYRNSAAKVDGRTGCFCHNPPLYRAVLLGTTTPT